MKSQLRFEDVLTASVSRGGKYSDSLCPKGSYTVTCFTRNGEIRWKENISNLVTTVGKNDLLNKYLKGSSYTASFFMGLKGVGSASSSDTQASHDGWLEVGGANNPTYENDRKVVVMADASSGSSSSPTQTFSITSNGTVAGCFTNIGGSATKDATSGVLFSVGDFSGGSKSVSNGDTLSVSYTLSV